MIDLEICGDSFESAKLAADYKFKRIELCANLSEGGTTPSFGMIQKCSLLKTIEVHVMIRPRPGSFVYSEAEVEIMAQDILAASTAGAKGVVLGCLTNENRIDLDSTLFLTEFALREKLEITFHRAIDYTPDPIDALNDLFQMGFKRVLTSGSKSNVNDGLKLLSEMVEFSKSNPIQIMAGGGVNASNAAQLACLGIHALHFTARKLSSHKTAGEMGQNYETDTEKMRAIIQSLAKN